MEISTSKQEIDSLLQQSKKRLKESLKPILLKRITLKVPEDEDIHYVHYQWSNSDRSMNMVMAEPAQAPLAARYACQPHGLPHAAAPARPAACVAVQGHRCLTGQRTTV